MMSFISPVALERAYLLINHGPAVLVSAEHLGVANVMAASWVTGLDLLPARLTVVLGKEAKTRELVEGSGHFVIQVPTAAQVKLTYQVGHVSLADDNDKLQNCNVQLEQLGDSAFRGVQGCSAWLACKLIREPHVEQTYDLFIGEVVGAWADTRVFNNNRWLFESADPSLRSLHYVAGGHFYAIGDALDVEEFS